MRKMPLILIALFIVALLAAFAMSAFAAPDPTPTPPPQDTIIPTVTAKVTATATVPCMCDGGGIDPVGEVIITATPKVTDTPTIPPPPTQDPLGGSRKGIGSKTLHMPYLAPVEDTQLDVPYLLNRAIAFLLAFGALALSIGGIALLNDIRKRTAKPALHLVLDALRPFAGQAIYAAEMLAANELTRIQTDFGGADKKSIADHFYDALPDTIMILGRAVPISIIKALVPRASWEALVQSVFDDAEARIGRNKDWLIKEAEKWRSSAAKSAAGKAPISPNG